MQFEIIWPERRIVSEEKIRSWYADAIDNGQVLPDFFGFEKEPKGMAMALADAGIITIGQVLP